MEIIDTGRNPLTFITLRHPAMHTPGRTQCEHTSSLSIGGNSAERNAAQCPESPYLLTVVGNLEHCARIMPATRADRDALVKHLRSIPYPRTRKARP